MSVYKNYNDIPIQCRICKHFLQDKDFIEEYKTSFVCTYDNDINPKLLEFCEEFNIGKWNLIDFLKVITQNG